MAVDTKLDPAVPHQATPPATRKQADDILGQDNSLPDTAVSVQTSGENKKVILTDKSGKVNDGIVKMTVSQSSDPTPKAVENNKEKKEMSNNTKIKNDDLNRKIEKPKESIDKTNVNKVNQIRNRLTPVNKTSESVKNVKVKNDAGSDITKGSSKTNCKDTLSEIKRTLPVIKQSPQEEDVLSEASSTEYVTFDAYVDMIGEGRTHERKFCFNKSEDYLTSSSCKPSSSSSSLSSVSNINDTPSSSQNDTAFDARSFRTSLLEASELPNHNITLTPPTKDKEYFGNICAWNPHFIVSAHFQSLDSKTNISKPTLKHRSSFQQQQHQNQSTFPPKISRSLTTVPSQREDVCPIPVYERLMSLGRYQAFVFQHRPDDWRWYMKSYTALHTVGRVGTKRKNKLLKWGVDTPDPYAMLGKKVTSSSNFDSRQHTTVQGDPVTSSGNPPERQPKKTETKEDNSDEAGNPKDRGYPVLAHTREANLANGHSNKSTKPEKVVRKSSKSDVQEKRNQKSEHIRNNTHAHAQAPRHPQHHHPHSFLPNLSTEDVRLNLISSKILHKSNENNDNSNDKNTKTNDVIATTSDAMDSQNEADIDDVTISEEKLWANPFQTTDADANASCVLQDDTILKNSLDKKELAINNDSKQNITEAAAISKVSDRKRNKNKSNKNSPDKKSTPSDQKVVPQHMKAELERDQDGTLVVKISVYNSETKEKYKSISKTVNGSVGKANGRGDEKGEKRVQICREETKLMGEELHTKLIDLNNKEMANKECSVKDRNRQDESGDKDTNKSPNKESKISQKKHNSLAGENKKVAEEPNPETFLSLQGTECKRRKSASKEKTDEERVKSLDSLDHYPKQRTAYQEIDFVNHSVFMTKPTIKYTKSKNGDSDLNRSTGNLRQNKDFSNDTKHNKYHLYQTMSIRSSTVHLATEVNLDENETADGISGRGVHQSYPVDEWKKTMDKGKCGFIVKSFPADKNETRKKKNSEQENNNQDEHIYNNAVQKLNQNIGELSSLKIKPPEEMEHVDGNNNNIIDGCKHNSIHVENLIDGFSPVSVEESTTNSSKSILKKGRPLYRHRPDLPVVKISKDDNNQITDEITFTNIRCLFPPLDYSDNQPEKTKTAQDDLFISGISHDRTRSRDMSFVSRKRPVSLDRGMIDDIVRYRTETSAVGFKCQPHHIHGHPQNSLLQHHSPHHHSFMHNHQHQPEESPSLMPSVQKLDKVHSNRRPRPSSPGDERKLGSISDRELNLKRQIELFAHLRKNSTAHAEKNINKIADFPKVLGSNRLP